MYRVKFVIEEPIPESVYRYLDFLPKVGEILSIRDLSSFLRSENNLNDSYKVIDIVHVIGEEISDVSDEKSKLKKGDTYYYQSVVGIRLAPAEDPIW